MQDIDFDEIDRAVSSVTNTPVTTVSEDMNSVEVQPPRPTTVPVPERTQPSPAAQEDAVSPAARRSSGRFMDVVHSSSDMRPGAPIVPAPRPVEPESTEATKNAAPVTGGAFQWPDPIDMHEASNNTPNSLDVDPVVAAATIGTEATPLESPFLSGAKVEKRPLGAFSDTFNTPPESIETPEDTALVGSQEATPDELHPDLLSLEGQEQQVSEQELPVQDEVPTTISSEEVPFGPVSITQQYKEQASATEASGSIFDTEAYHQALTHAPKKTSRLLIVVWLVGLVLVGGGIGAAVYFLVIPTLN